MLVVDDFGPDPAAVGQESNEDGQEYGAFIQKGAISHSFDYPESAENSSETEKGFENRDVEDGSIFQVVVSVERREPGKPESQRDAKDGFQPYPVNGFPKKFLGIQTRHDAEKTEQRKNGPADDGATQDDYTFMELPEELVIVGVARTLAKDSAFIKLEENKRSLQLGSVFCESVINPESFQEGVPGEFDRMQFAIHAGRDGPEGARANIQVFRGFVVVEQMGIWPNGIEQQIFFLHDLTTNGKFGEGPMLVVQQLAGDRHDGGADAVRQRKDPDSNGALVLVPRGTNNLIEKVGKEQINRAADAA